MEPKMNIIPAGEFKAKCLGILEEVHETGRPVMVTKHGVPYAIVIPYQKDNSPQPPLFGIMKESITIHEDIISPINEKWDAEE